ncbi:MAG: glycoside hydrolase [Halobacteriales archaeon]|nr:glycoside hydrolase [Halobacteriales archaeon]
MRLAFAAALLALLTLSLSGCTTPPAAPPPAPGPTSAGSVAYALDCGPREDGWPEGCIYRASHNPGPKEETAAAVNPKDPRNVVAAAKDLDPAISDKCVWNGIYITKDGGATWRDVHIGGNFSDRQPGDPTYGYACNTDPDLAFAQDGTLYYAVEMYQYDAATAVPDPTGLGLVPGGSEFLLAKSTDGGLTWPTLTIAELGDGLAVFNDYSRMCVSPKTGTVAYATGTYNTPGFLVGAAGAPASGVFVTVVTSHDGAQTADPPQLLTNQQAPGQQNIGAIACAPDGTIVVTMYDAAGQVFLATSNDDGRSFDNPAPVFQMNPIAGTLPNTQFRTFSTTELTFDKGNHLWMTWADNRTGNADVMVSHSHDKGRTWDDAVRVNDDNTTHAQWMPDIAVTADGVVHVLFMDRRWDPGDRLIDMAYAYSSDDGARWTNVRATNASFDGDLGVHQAGFPFIGDYLGLDAVGFDVWGSFPDCVTGTCVIGALHAHRSTPGNASVVDPDA